MTSTLPGTAASNKEDAPERETPHVGLKKIFVPVRLEKVEGAISTHNWFAIHGINIPNCKDARSLRWRQDFIRTYLERGFHAACADLEPARRFVVYPGTERYRMAENVEAISLAELAAELRGSR